MIAVGDGDAGVRGRGHGGGNAGDDFKWHPGGGEFLRLFAASAKDEWIAAFEADDSFALLGFFDEEGVEFVLRDGVIGGAFAGEDDFGVGGGELEEGGIAEGIIGDDLGTGEQFGAAHGEQADIAGTGAD
jgi:hypothetical protein